MTPLASAPPPASGPAGWPDAVVEGARRRLSEVADRLGQTEARATRIAHETQWRSRAAAAYRRDAAEWCHELHLLAARVEALAHDLDRPPVAWRGGP